MTSISLADAKAHMSDVVSRVSKHHERVTVTVHGQPSAVLISPDDLAMLEETIAVLGDQDLMMQLAAAEADLAAGRVETQEDLEAAMRSRQTSAGSPMETQTSVCTNCAPASAVAGSSVIVTRAPLSAARSVANAWISGDGRSSAGAAIRTSAPRSAPVTSSEFPMLYRASPR